jgi:peroxiredoxin
MIKAFGLATLAVLVGLSVAAGAAEKKAAGPEELALGKAAPAFELPGTDGTMHAFKDVAGPKGTLVVSPATLPVRQGLPDPLDCVDGKVRAVGGGRGRHFQQRRHGYPDDAFPKMKERAAEMKYNFPYLYDESQSVALLYGPKVTPHCFLFDAKGVLVYRGRIDDSAKEAEVTKRELTDALDALVGGKPIAAAQTTAFGCGIKWKAAATAPLKKSS